MPSILLEYQLVIRNAANTADAITFSSVAGDSAPYLEGAPTCDGQEINPLTGEFRSGSFTGYIVDQITSGTSRAFTSQLEDANFRQQLAGRLASWKVRVNGGTWTVLGAGYLTLLALVSGARWQVVISDATRVEDNAVAFSPRQGTLVLSANALVGATSISVSALPFAIANGVILVFLSGKQATVTAAAASGATSVAVSALASGLASGDSAPITESFASYFARWPQRGCLFGGLITKDPNDATSTGFLGVPDLGGWIVKVTDQSSLGGEDRASGTTFLYPLVFYTPPDVKPSNNPATGIAGVIVTGTMKGAASVVNPAADPLVTAGGLYAYAPGFPTEFKSVWPGLVYQIALASGAFTGAASEFYAPEGDDAFSGPAPYASKYENGIIDIGHGHPGPCIQGTALAISSTKYRMRGLTCLPTESSPLYWTGHPIDLFKKLMDDQGRAYDSTACENVRQAIGADRRLSVRIVALPKLNEFLKNAIYAPFGIGVRMNAAGLLEPFCMRIFNNSPPTTTITSADIRHDSHGVGIQSWFELDEASAIRTVVFEYQNFFLTQDGAAFNSATEKRQFPPDGVAVQRVRIERQNGDPGAIGNGIATFTVPGMIHAKDIPLQTVPMDASLQTASPATSWVNQLVYEIFDRWGRGVIKGELPLLRGGAGDTLQLGDELLNQIPQLPNRNKRYGDDNTVGARAMQIVRLTPAPVGALVKLIDSGPNAAAVATLPTATIVASPLTHLARRVALVTVTNAATLNAAGIGVELQTAVTTGAAPAATDYTAAGKFPYGQIPTGVIVLPSVRGGRTVWARLRSTQLGARPSAWTTPISVTLGTLNAISGLTVTPNAGDGTQAAVAWTVGANAGLAAIDVYLRPSAQPASTAVRVAVLGNTSTGYTLEDLIPNTSYTVGVQARDVDTLFGSDVSSVVETTFTTANVTPALAAPQYPQWFQGSIAPLTGLPRADGHYGMAVYATVFPGLVEFWQALETAVGAGTYGSFVLVATVPSAQGDWTKFSGIAPHDGLRRQIKARHVRENATASAFTAIGTVTPWGTATRLALPPFTRSVPSADDGQYTPIAGADYNLSSGILPSAGVVEGSSTFSLYRHREDISILGPDTDGDVAYTFAQTYQNVPMIVFRGGQFVTFSNTIGTAVKQRTRIQVLNATSSGFTSRAQIASVGATTAQNDDFASGNSITVAGNTAVLTLVPGGANDNTYTIHYFVSVTVDANGTHFCTATVVVAIDTNDGSGWVERATFSYSASPLSGPPPFSAATTTQSHEQHPVTVSGLTSGTQIRVRAKSFSVTNTGTGSFTIRGGDAAGSNPETFNGATYNTAADTVESAIPSGGDSVQWAAQEVA